jgi:hypothetical protein
MGWMMVIWSVLSAGLIVWLVEEDAADAAVHGSWEPDDDGRCACCRHDRVAHEDTGPGRTCSQCPCPGFRASG